MRKTRKPALFRTLLLFIAKSSLKKRLAAVFFVLILAFGSADITLNELIRGYQKKKKEASQMLIMKDGKAVLNPGYKDPAVRPIENPENPKALESAKPIATTTQTSPVTDEAKKLRLAALTQLPKIVKNLLKKSF